MIVRLRGNLCLLSVDNQFSLPHQKVRVNLEIVEIFLRNKDSIAFLEKVQEFSILSHLHVKPGQPTCSVRLRGDLQLPRVHPSVDNPA